MELLDYFLKDMHPLNSQEIESWLRKRVKKDTLLWSILRCCYNIYIVATRKQFYFSQIYLYFHKYILKNTIFRFKHQLEMASLFPKKIIDKTVEIINPKSVLDLGCGVGKSLDHFLSKGIEVVGVEGSSFIISKANHPELIIEYNLNNELNLDKKFDLIWSFEFVEHIQPIYINNLLKTFSNHSDRIVISAAEPGLRGSYHFNEKPSIYWISQFKKYGYSFDEYKTNELRKIDEPHSESMLVFERKES